MKKEPRFAKLSFLSIGIGILFLSCNPNPDPIQTYALVYGVSAYVEVPLRLFFSHKDAKDVAALLQSSGVSGQNITLRTDSAATREQLIQDVADLSRVADPDSLFLFYFSGHGVQVETSPGASTEFIFFFHPTSTLRGGVSDSELMQLIAAIPSNRKIVIFDSCNSGGFIGDFPGIDAVPQDYTGSRKSYLHAAQEAFVKYFANVEEGDIPYTEALVIAAAGAPEFTYEPNPANPLNTIQNGFFTHYLLQTPLRADRNADGWITALEAYAYIRDQIEQNLNPLLEDFGAFVFLPRISGGPLDIVLFPAK